MFKPNALYLTDGYKVGHKRMLAKGTDFLYGTDIPRSLKNAPKGITKIVSFGQQFTVIYLHDFFTENFFSLSKEEAMEFAEDMSSYLGISYDGQHFSDLHDLGYLPMRIKALPEGIETNPNIPHMTFVNTKKGFAWLTLYVETIISALSWKISTAATIALKFKRAAIAAVTKTDPANAFLIPYLCHDFSARGLDPFTMAAVGLGHATSFVGSDTLVTIPASRYFYGVGKKEVVIASVNASEHSVSTTKIFTVGEKQMLVDWMEEFPTGILSVVMDTMDLTKVVRPVEGGYLHDLKELIMSRNGKLVIRPDSAPSGRTPADIICGHDKELTDRELEADYPEFYHKGLIQCLWEIFGGVINEKGYKVLDPHIGGIYGDSISPDIQVEIYERLAAKGFAATNIVLGVGSYTYQFVTRDTLGFAIKGAWFEAEGKGYNIYKDPKTDSGTKKSLKGRICVMIKPNQKEEGEVEYIALQEVGEEEEKMGLLQTIYEDGKFYNKITFSEIRERLS